MSVNKGKVIKSVDELVAKLFSVITRKFTRLTRIRLVFPPTLFSYNVCPSFLARSLSLRAWVSVLDSTEGDV